MYEKTFNEEVYLRLKFEEKINQAYTCYEDLKAKYDAMKEELGYNRVTIAGQSMNHRQIKDNLEMQLARN